MSSDEIKTFTDVACKFYTEDSTFLLIAANTYSLIMFHYYFTYEENLLFDQTPKSSYLTIQGYCRRKCIRNFGKIRSPVRTQAFKTSGRVK